MKARANALAVVLVGCTGRIEPPSQVDAPEPWHDLDPLPLEAFQAVLVTSLQDLEIPRRLEVLPELPLTMVHAEDPDAVYVLDQRYQNTADSQCIDTILWPELDDDPARQGDCKEGETESSRGIFAPEAGVLAVAADSPRRALWTLDGQGTLYRADVDVFSGNPLDFGQMFPVANVALPGKGGVATLRVLDDGSLLLARGAGYVILSDAGLVLDEHTTNGEITDVVVDGADVWLLTTQGVVHDGQIWDPAGFAPRAVPDGAGGLHLTVPSRDALVHIVLDGDEFSATEQTIVGLTGPLARDAETGRIVAAIDPGLVLVEPDGAVQVVSDDRIVDVASGPPHETVLLLASGAVAVHYDQQALTGPEPLGVWMSAMAENPRSSPTEVACAGEEDSLDVLFENGLRNTQMLASQPMPVALGLTPALTRRARQCGAGAAYPLLWGDDRVETGVLFHDVPDGCSGENQCYTAFIEDEASAVSRLGSDVSWVGGLDGHYDQGYDWVAGTLAAGVTDRVQFFGLGILPEISQSDPRNKEPHPYEVGEAPTARFVDSASDLSPRDDGLLWLQGNTVSAYSLGGCGNLFINECKLLNRGGRAEFSTQDIAVLDLLLHRALAARSEAGPDTWFLHMPAVGLYDYTDGCDVDVDGFYTGEDCEAALIQTWTLAVHQRFVSEGLIRWMLPSEVVFP